MKDYKEKLLIFLIIRLNRFYIIAYAQIFLAQSITYLDFKD